MVRRAADSAGVAGVATGNGLIVVDNAHLLGGGVDDRLARLLVARAEGNALLIRKLIRSVQASGSLRRSYTVWRLVGSLPVGQGVVDLILGALSGLSEEETSATQTIAVGEPMLLRTAEQLA